jgi:ubiquinone/menaquinone biosynthesis C-methylase UbiE
VDLDVIVRRQTAPSQVAATRLAAEGAARKLGVSGAVYVADAADCSLARLVLRSSADFIMLVDDSVADLLERAEDIWSRRADGDLLISSRYSDDRGTRPKELHHELERYMDRWLARVLTLDTTDVRSTIQMLRRETARDLIAGGCDLEDPMDVCVRCAVAGWRTVEVRRPFWPRLTAQPVTPQRPSTSAIFQHWARRNGIDSADYDMRAFNSRIPLQRAWQRRRYSVTYELVEPFAKTRILNVGAGSARLSLDLPGSVSVDNVHAKLRYMRRYKVNPLVTASIFHLPFPDSTFDCVVCCEVVEHVPHDPSPIGELVRVLRPGGRLVLSTPDYGTWVWPTIERLYAAAQPKGYADEHITRYTEQTLVEELDKFGLRPVALNKVYRSILVGAFE